MAGAVLALAFACAAPEIGIELQKEQSDAIIGVPLADGPILGDPTPRGVLVWARAERAATLHVEVAGRVTSAPLEAAHDFAATIPIRTGPASIGVWATEGERPGKPPREVRRFAPPPGPTERAAVRIGFGGDLAGQNVCRHATEGFAVLAAIAERELDAFIGLGDMIYADQACLAAGAWGQPQVPGELERAQTREAFWAHWRYTRADPHLSALLARTPYVAVWDDHEVVNDFGRETPLLPEGLAAFRDHNPLPETLHRTLRFGSHLALVILDTRQHRDANAQLDTDDAPKTMLGARQRAWLAEQLRVPATWHVIVSSVPIAIPTGWPAVNGRDGWSNLDQETGFERELRAIFEDAHAAGARLVFLTTDVHFAAVHRFEPIAGYAVHELVTGPLSAGLFPTQALDETFSPTRLFFHGPADIDAVRSWEEGRRFLNWGELAVDEAGVLTLEIRGVDGDVLFTHTLAP